MIGTQISHLRNVCKEIEQVENYDEAINDKEYLWILHHRDEIRELPSGMVALRSAEYLKSFGLYYHRPADELIFLRNDEHSDLHAKYLTDESKFMMGNGNRGRKFTKEHKRKLSESHKGQVSWCKGKKLSDVHVSNLWKSNRKHALSEFGYKFIEHFGINPIDNRKLYHKEIQYYLRHNRKARWEEK